MEKLRAALDKARKSREESIAPAGTEPVAPKAQGVTTSGLSARWQALTAFEARDKDLIRHRVVTGSARKAATPFDILRTKTVLQMRQNGWKRLAITSPMPSSGKTTMACNLALGLGRQRDLRTMLFDLDLRDPSVHDFFETRPPYSISEMLTGVVSFEEQALRHGENVAISMSQDAESDPTRILLSEDTVEVLNAIEDDYEPDIVIFDLPSLLVNDDSRAFLKNADCALIVTRADMTTFSQFETCQREIAEQTNILGVVLNAYRHDKRAVETA